MNADQPETILSVRNLRKSFALERGLWSHMRARATGRSLKAVHAVDDVSFSVKAGETVGIVGESGCGKSTLARMLAGLASSTGGDIVYRDRPFAETLQDRKAALDIQMVFQDPQSSINPRLQVIDIVGQAPVVHGLIPRERKAEYVVECLEKVGLSAEFLHRYPHQFSGGQRQRVGIARALAVNPKLLICDESVAALDVSGQAQIIDLFMQIRDELGLTMLFISQILA